MISSYDHEKLYKSEILPLLNQMKKICAMNGLPFVFMCATKNDEKKTIYQHDGLPAAGLGLSLKDDLFENYLVAINGGKFVPSAVLDLSADDGINKNFDAENENSTESMVEFSEVMDKFEDSFNFDDSGFIDDGELI